MAASRGTVQQRSGLSPRPIDQLWFGAPEEHDSAAVDGWSVLLLGLDELPDDSWAVPV